MVMQGLGSLEQSKKSEVKIEELLESVMTIKVIDSECLESSLSHYDTLAAQHSGDSEISHTVVRRVVDDDIRTGTGEEVTYNDDDTLVKSCKNRNNGLDLGRSSEISN